MLKDFTKEKFDIIIQAGQSNSQGTSFGDTSNPWIPDERVWYMNENDTISLAEEKVAFNEIQSNFGLEFCREYINAGRLSKGRKILILRAAIGGTGFMDKRWNLTDDLFLHMMEMIRTALELNPENRLIALLWHQGENEVILGSDYDKHYKNLITLLRTVRETYACPDLPFIAGDFVPQWRDANFEGCAPICDAMRDVCRDCGYGGFVAREGLLSNKQVLSGHPFGWPDDTIHFSRPAIYELGKRYYEKVSEIIDKDNENV